MANIKNINVGGQSYSVGYSSNDYTSSEKSKLAGVAAGAQVNVIESVKVEGGNVSLAGKVANITGLQKKLVAGNGISINDDGTISINLSESSPFKFEDELPTPAPGWRPGTTPATFDIYKIYVVPNKSGAEGNLYNEYIWDNVKGKWELVGEFKSAIDLSPYLKIATYNADKKKIEGDITENKQSIAEAKKNAWKTVKFGGTVSGISVLHNSVPETVSPDNVFYFNGAFVFRKPKGGAVSGGYDYYANALNGRDYNDGSTARKDTYFINKDKQYYFDDVELVPVGKDVIVDSSLSDSSTNSVQNKVIKKAIDEVKNNKVDKVSGKQLSANDYTTTEKNKLAGVSTGANKVTFSVSGETLTITVV